MNWRDRNNELTKVMSDVVVVGSCEEPFRVRWNPDDGIRNPDSGER
jgi:hypothetical protein